MTDLTTEEREIAAGAWGTAAAMAMRIVMEVLAIGTTSVTLRYRAYNGAEREPSGCRTTSSSISIRD